jgi:hypothetical protein
VNVVDVVLDEPAGMLLFKFSQQFAPGRLTRPDHKDGKISFEQFLMERYPLS